jgi:hypothetical protein
MKRHEARRDITREWMALSSIRGGSPELVSRETHARGWETESGLKRVLTCGYDLSIRHYVTAPRECHQLIF